MVQSIQSDMLQLKGLLFSSYLLALAASAAVKVPKESEWTNVVPKSVYSRALGPPMVGMDTITVPYMPKSPFFPKFVDPKSMISKKTDLLGNLFGGIGPAAYPPDFKPFVPYGAAAPTLYSTADGKEIAVEKNEAITEEDMTKYKRGIFGPFPSPGKFGPMGPKFGPMGPKFGGVPPKFGGIGAKFNPMMQFDEPSMMPDFPMKDSFSRKRRSVESPLPPSLQAFLDNSKPLTKDLGPPPPYPTLAPISEEQEIEANGMIQKADGSMVPKQYLPGMFGPMVDPSMFIAKKNAFLDTLFKNIATSTPPPAVTEVPLPKSTIVPPSFWYPTSIIPGPMDYDTKVSEFLDKLFDSLKLNKTAVQTDEDETPKGEFARSVAPEDDVTQARIARSMKDLSTISAAKDTIVDSILSELGDLKTDMMSTMNDLITYQKTAAASAAASMIPKKPFKPFAAGFWPKPTVDVMLPFKQRMAALGQVFDMLTDLQKNITTAVEASIKANLAAATESTESPVPVEVPPMPGNAPINMTLLDAIKNKLSSLEAQQSAVDNMFKPGTKTVRTLPKTPTSFWVSYPEEASTAVKREVNEEPVSTDNEENDSGRHEQHTRAVKMQMHQGYQSLPAGAVESVQAGGGSTPGHQGGGIKLFDNSGYEDIEKWIDWAQYLRNEHQGRRHNHNHH